MYIDNNSKEVINYVSRKLTTVTLLTPLVFPLCKLWDRTRLYKIRQQLNYNI